MDVNRTLERMRELQAEINAEATWPSVDPYAAAENAAPLYWELAELADALDQWLTRGGMLPAAWRNAASQA